MKRKIIGVILCVFVVMSIVGCSVPSTTTIYLPTTITVYPTISPTTTLTYINQTTTSQNIPSIQGQIYFVDGTPGYKTEVLLRNEGSSGETIDNTYADLQGYYRFYNIVPGTYWLNTVTDNSYVENEPSAIVTITPNATSKVENLTVPKDVFVTFINGIEIPYLNPYHDTTIVSGHNYTFTWTGVESATSYDVEIWSTYTQQNPSNKDYDSTVRTNNNTITWSIDLSTLSYTDFRIDITAYNANNTVIAQNYELFTIKQ